MAYDKGKILLPKPHEVQNCQVLGHTSALPLNLSPCARTLCVNCSADHSASKACIKFIQIQAIQTQNKCSLREAVNIHKAQIPTSKQFDKHTEHK